MDWERLGEADGDFGYPRERIDEHVARCARYGIDVDRAAWELGFDGGNEDYCTTAGGLAAGRRGGGYVGVCSGEYEQEFLAGYRIGYELNAVDTEYQSILSRLNNYERRLYQHSDITPGSDTPEVTIRIIRLRQRLTALEFERTRLEREAELLLGPR